MRQLACGVRRGRDEACIEISPMLIRHAEAEEANDITQVSFGINVEPVKANQVSRLEQQLYCRTITTF